MSRSSATEKAQAYTAGLKRKGKAANTMKRYSAEADMAAERSLGAPQQEHYDAVDRAKKVDKIYRRTLKRARPGEP